MYSSSSLRAVSTVQCREGPTASWDRCAPPFLPWPFRCPCTPGTINEPTMTLWWPAALQAACKTKSSALQGITIGQAKDPLHWHFKRKPLEICAKDAQAFNSCAVSDLGHSNSQIKTTLPAFSNGDQQSGFEMRFDRSLIHRIS